MSAIHQLNELSSEALDNIAREAEQLRKKWSNRLRLPFDRLSERYLRGDLSIHIHGRTKRDKLPLCFVFSHESAYAAELEPNGGDEYAQFPVFVRNVHIVNQPKGIAERVGSMIRLKALDSCENGRARNPFHFSIVTLQPVFLGTGIYFDGVDGVDREFDSDAMLLSKTGVGQFPNEMIQGRSKMVDNLSCEDAKTQGRITICMIPKYLEGFEVAIGERWVSAHHFDSRQGREQNSNFGFEITDCLLGPF